MSTLELNTKDESLREVFSNGKKYCIPKFQRDYSWEQSHWEELWEDIRRLLQGQESYHYMGYLVIQAPGEKFSSQPFKVIDGQQRLITFSLMILAAVKRLREIEATGERADELLKSFIGNKDLQYLRVDNKLKLNRNNDYYYKEATAGSPLPASGVKKTVRLMKDAIAYFYQRYRQITDGAQIGADIEKISARILFTTIYIGDELNAYKVFETLNARGVRLSSGDLIKNYIFSLADSAGDTPDEVLDELDDKWENIGGSIGKEDYTDYILAHWNSGHKLARKSGLFAALRKDIGAMPDAKAYLDDIAQNSALYAALLAPEDDFWRDHADYIAVRKNLSALRLFNIKQPLSLLLRAYAQLPDQFAQILRWITVLSFRYNVICRQHTGEQESLYNAISVEMLKNGKRSAVKSGLLKLYPNDAQFEQSFAGKSMPTGQSYKKARYILARLQEHLSGASIDDSGYTVEHILPQEATPEWRDYFGDSCGEYCQRIGNMALVTPAENKQLARKPFEEKQPMLCAGAMQINHDIGAYAEWSADAIDARQKQLAKIAAQVWRID